MTLTYATYARTDIPTITARVTPHAIGGGGVANIKERFNIARRDVSRKSHFRVCALSQPLCNPT